ncbi:Ser/Thr protein kinase RdoA involved in Cpx stress response, MazF antagonist [Kaistia soli DSM 19436]|uniref:Ser/Thr protein kinase RdoA involved in Cpx stress response, MazF antagonist n=2 Tax=Kaistia TaxID=166953 RepID=A0A1M5AK88_9HYPH|nr:Ser/Thr protein kinase RdoA involved in Cpx stress response, MazF antagonist [Kaistia soli DSM 19436]
MRLSKDRVDDAIKTLELGRVVDITPLSGGTSPVFRLDLSSDVSVVLKSYPDDGDKTPAREALAARQFLAVAVPVTRYLLIDETRNVLPFRFAITNCLPGVAGGSLKDHRDIASLYRQTGGLLRTLHAIAMPAYGAFGPDGIIDPVSTNAAFIRRIIEDAFGRFAAFGADTHVSARLRAIIEQHFQSVTSHSIGAVFAHDDLHPNNVLAVEDDRGNLVLSGLVDFGNARAADAVFDLAKCLFCSEHDAPGSTPHILAGYGEIDHPSPALAIWYYTILHRMVMWWWLRHVGVIPSATSPSDLMDRLIETGDSTAAP